MGLWYSADRAQTAQPKPLLQSWRQRKPRLFSIFLSMDHLDLNSLVKIGRYEMVSTVLNYSSGKLSFELRSPRRPFQPFMQSLRVFFFKKKNKNNNLSNYYIGGN